MDIEVPTLFSKPEASLSSATNGDNPPYSSTEGSKTPVNPKSVPTTPFPPTIPASPRVDNVSNINQDT